MRALNMASPPLCSNKSTCSAFINWLVSLSAKTIAQAAA